MANATGLKANYGYSNTKWLQKKILTSKRLQLLSVVVVVEYGRHCSVSIERWRHQFEWATRRRPWAHHNSNSLLWILANVVLDRRLNLTCMCKSPILISFLPFFHSTGTIFHHLDPRRHAYRPSRSGRCWSQDATILFIWWYSEYVIAHGE